MQKIFLIAWACLAAITLQAGTPMPVLDLRSQLRVNHLENTAHPQRTPGRSPALDLYESLIVQLEGAGAVDSLEEMGAVVWHTRGKLALVCMPRRLVGDMSRRHFVDGVSTARVVAPTLDKSRAASHVPQVHGMSTQAFPLGIDGTGVVAGICDIGVDPGHAAFDGRIGMMAVYTDSLAMRKIYAPGTTLHNAPLPATDNPDETHATHVLNILGGTAHGTPYGGYAPGAILAPTLSYLTDVALLCGIEDIIAYAKERGMPAVVNLSVGSYLGPHDGTDLVNRYLDMLGQEALICFSAGNNGSQMFSLEHTLGHDSPAQEGGLPAVGSMLESRTTWAGYDIRGALDLWSADARPFQFRIVAYDQTDKKFVYRGPWMGPDLDGVAADDSRATGCFTLEDENISRCFPGSRMSGAWGTDALNGRYMAALDYNIQTEAELPGGHHWARYVIGWQVRAPKGTHIYAYTDGVTSYMRWYSTPGQIDGSTAQTISNLCCGNNVVAVGAWNTRNTAPVWPQGQKSFNYATDNVASFSSYGTLVDGRKLPHIAAPGNTVVSAMSGPYAAAHPAAERSYKLTAGGADHWYFEQCGTSMASPAVAGILALWLQAYPQLSVSQALDILRRTARRDFSDIDNPRWGAGAVDAAAGLQEVMKLSGVHDIASAGPKCLVRVEGNRIVVTTADGSPAAATVHNLAGRLCPTETPLAPGIYIVRADGRTYKVMVP